jgi:hypothetical protein
VVSHAKRRGIRRLWIPPVRPPGSSWWVLRTVRLRTLDWTLISVDVGDYAGQGFDLRLGTYTNSATDGGMAVMYVDSLSLQACMPKSGLKCGQRQVPGQQKEMATAKGGL